MNGYKDKNIIFAFFLLLTSCTQFDNEIEDIKDSFTQSNCFQSQTVSSFCDLESSIIHKKWAKKYHSKFSSDKHRYLNNLSKLTGIEVKNLSIKPKMLDFYGFEEKDSMNSYRGEGEQGLVKGASSFAFKGDEFWSVTVDYSECKNKSGFSDCKQSEGSSRVETRDNKHWSMYEGSEVWIHYAIQPKINILFRNDNRRFTVGQCHPSDVGGHKGLTWMLRFRGSDLYIVQYFKHYDLNFKDNDGEWKIKRATLDPETTSWKQTHTLLKKFDANEFKGSNEWTSVMIHHVQSNQRDKGLLEVYIDGDWTNPVYSYKGEMSIPDKNKCYFKFGLYTNGNETAIDRKLVENMTVWYDNMAIAKSKSKLLEIINSNE